MKRWPYITALGAALLGVIGFGLAPFAGIAYPLALPGLLVASWWLLLHKAPHRIELAAAAGLLCAGLLAALTVLWGPVAGMRPASEKQIAGVFGTLFLLPLPVLAVAIVASVAGLTRVSSAGR